MQLCRVARSEDRLQKVSGGIEKANEGGSCIEPPGVMLYHVQLPLLMWPLLWMAHATAVQHLACVYLPALCRGCVLVIPLRFSRGVDPQHH